MMFKCPVCGDRHTVPDNYDNKEYVCLNTSNRVSQKIFQDLKPTDILSRNSYNWNRSSTKEDAGRPATVLVGGPDFRPTGDKIGTLKKNY